MSFIEVKEVDFITGTGGQILGRFAWSEYDNGSYSKHLYSISEAALPLPERHYKFFKKLCLQSKDPEGNLKKFKGWHMVACQLNNGKAARKRLEKHIDLAELDIINMKEVK